MLSLTNGAATQLLTDPGNTGILNFMGQVGSFAFNLTSGSSKPATGTATDPQLDLSSIDVTAFSGGTLTIGLTDVGFIGAGGISNFLSAVSGFDTAGSLSVTTYMDCGNTAFGQGTQLTAQSFASTGISGNQSASVAACSGSYSLTQLAVLNLPSLAVAGFQSNLSDPPSGGGGGGSVPEPATAALLSVGLLSWVGFARLRGQRVAI